MKALQSQKLWKSWKLWKSCAAFLLITSAMILANGHRVLAGHLVLSGDSAGLTITPSKTLFRIPAMLPGESKTGGIAIRNTGAKAYKLYVKVVDLHPYREEPYTLLDPNLSASPESDVLWEPGWTRTDPVRGELLYPLQITVSLDGNPLADFPVKGSDTAAGSPPGYYPLGIIPAYGGANLAATVSLLGLHMDQNEYQEKKAELDWYFIAEFTDETITPPPDTGGGSGPGFIGGNGNPKPVSAPAISSELPGEPRVQMIDPEKAPEGNPDLPVLINQNGEEPLPDHPVSSMMPKTGESLWLSLLLGGVLAGAGLALLFKRKKK